MLVSYVQVQKKKDFLNAYKYIYWLGLCRESFGQGFGYNWSYHKLKTKGIVFPIETFFFL